MRDERGCRIIATACHLGQREIEAALEHTADITQASLAPPALVPERSDLRPRRPSRGRQLPQRARPAAADHQRRRRHGSGHVVNERLHRDFRLRHR